MSEIQLVHARQVFDSRGNPTVEVEVALKSGAEGLAAAEGRDWNDLGPDDQIAYYARARLNEETRP